MPEGGNETISIRVLGDSRSGVTATNEAVAGLKRVEAQSGRTSSATKMHAREAVAANAALTGSFRSMARQAVTAGAGFAAAYIGIAKAKDAISTTADLARQTEILSRNTGLATKTTSAMLVTLKSLGVDTAGVSMSFQTLGRNVAQAEAGSKKTQAAFSALGITTGDLKAAHGDLNILLPKIADGFGNLKGNADRVAVSQALLGRGYKSLLPLFADGAAGLQRQIDTAEKFGAVIDGKTLKQLERLHNAQVKNREAALGLKIAFSQAATPALLGISTIAQKVATDLEGPGSLDDKLSKIGKDIGPALSKVEGVFEAAIPKIANHVGQDAPKVAKAFIQGFLHADGWGQLALGAFIVSRTAGWGKVFAAIGASNAVSWLKGFGPTAEAGAAAEGRVTGMNFAVGFRKFMFYGIAAAVTTDLYNKLVGPVNGVLDQLGLAINATDPTNGRGQAAADARAHSLRGIKSVPTGGIPGLSAVPKGAASRMGTVLSAAQKYGIDPSILWGIYGAESSFGKAKSYFGLTSDYPGKGTSGNFGKDANRSAQILAGLIQSQGGLDAALRKYSGGSYGLAHIKDVLGNHPAGAGAGGKSYSQLLADLNKKAPKADTTPADLAWAKSMVGHFKESTGSNTGPELDRLQKEFGTHAAAWCAEFATTALVKAGFPKDIMTARVGDLNAWAKAGAKGLSFTTSPSPGDLMTFGNDHVAIVEKVNQHTGKVTTIAGNTGAGKVSRATYSLSDGKYISTNAAGYTPFKEDNVVKVPGITQGDLMGNLSNQLNHFDLLVGAGLLSQSQANAQKRKAIRQMLPNLTGDTALGALGTLRSLKPGVKPSRTLGIAQGILGGRDDWLNVASQLQRRSGVDPNSVAGLQATGGQLQSRVGFDDKALLNLKVALWDANNKGSKTLAAQIGEQIKTVVADRNEALTQIAENTAATTQAVNDAADQAAEAAKAQAEADRQTRIGDLMGGASQFSSLTQLAGMPGGRDLIKQFLPGLDGQGLSPTGLADFLKQHVLPGLVAAGDIPDAISVMQEIASNTAQTADNTQDLSDFWKQRAYSLAQSLAVSQSQYGVFKNFSAAPTPYLGGFDSGGIVPGPMGQPGFALVHGGETVLPTHKSGGVPIVNVYVSADARAAGVRVDQSIGRDMRQLSIAPGR